MWWETASASHIPGSATVLDQSVLEEARVFTVNEALRKVPACSPATRRVRRARTSASAP